MRALTRVFVLSAAIAVAFDSRTEAADSFDGWWRLDEKASTGVPPTMRGHDTVVHLTQSGDKFTIELHAVEPRIDPPPGTPHIADVVLRARHR